MEEFLLVPAKEDPREVARVKGELTDNARLTYAGELGAKKRRLLKDPSLTPDKKMIKLLPVSKALARETRRIRQFKVPDTETEEEDTELVSPAMEKWMRRMATTFGRQTKWQKRLEALDRGILAGYKSRRPTLPPKPSTRWQQTPGKPTIPPKPKKLQFDSPLASPWSDPGPSWREAPLPPPLPPLLSEPGPSGREPRPFDAEDLVRGLQALKPTPVDQGKGKGKGKGKTPLARALESALATKFGSSKGGDTDEGESDEDDGWLGRLRPRPTRAPKTWEEW